MDIGCNIKRLRQDRSLTQEELAERIGVTPQAVSKWENGVGLPDISQVVPLARVFGVSTDELFGVIDNKAENEEVRKRINELWEKWDEIRRAEPEHVILTHYATYLFNGYMEILEKFPGNAQVLSFCIDAAGAVAGHYFGEGDEARATFYFNECERMAAIILNSNCVEHYKDSAKKALIRLHIDAGQYEKAMEHVLMLPEIYEPRNKYIADIYKASGEIEKEFRERVVNVSNANWDLRGRIVELGETYYSKGEYADALNVYESLYEIQEIVYREELTRSVPFPYVGYFGGIIKCLTKLGDIDGAFDKLDEFIDAGFENARLLNEGYYEHKTPLLRGAGNLLQVSDELLKMHFLIVLDNEALQPYRSDPRYIELRKRVDALT